MSEPLLDKIAAGDRDAVARCLDRYGNLVWSLARRFSADPADAEDAVQEIFIDLWANAGRFDPAKASETTFVAMIARRRLIDRLRKRGREPELDPIDDRPLAGEHDPAAELETRDRASRASRVIRALQPDQQQVIRLAVLGGHSHRRIAEALGMPLGTVKSHLRRGLSRVREAMTEGMR